MEECWSSCGIKAGGGVEDLSDVSPSLAIEHGGADQLVKRSNR